jgi:hypothetical protein
MRQGGRRDGDKYRNDMVDRDVQEEHDDSRVIFLRGRNLGRGLFRPPRGQIVDADRSSTPLTSRRRCMDDRTRNRVGDRTYAYLTELAFRKGRADQFERHRKFPELAR